METAAASPERRLCSSNPRTDGAPWEPWEGNGPCQDCSARNVLWFTTNATWNTVMGPDGAGLLCPSCFAIRAHAAGLDCTWRLVPETGQDNQDYWLARLDEREKLQRGGHLVGTPDPLPVQIGDPS
jgi:hypothetical protein